ncbi:MAG TPA: hypothetical protein VL793_00655, partial [Patescibacteria group bacterium]|nr:hypothetical protein [Patescibacteria group bacterium]
MMTANLTKPPEVSTAIQKIPTNSGELVVEKRFDVERLEVSLRVPTQKKCVLHWGVRANSQSGWQLLPSTLWPEGTTAAGTAAMQTTFKRSNGESRITILLKPDNAPDLLEFVLFFPEEGSWDNNRHHNYQISLDIAATVSPADYLRSQQQSGDLVFERTFVVETSRQIAVAIQKSEGEYLARFVTNLQTPLVLHWGVSRRSPQEWLLPPESWRPAGTVLSDGHTAQSPFERRDGLNQLQFTIPDQEAPLGIQFVLKQGSDGPWIKHNSGNFYVPIRAAGSAPGLDAAGLAQLAERIVQAEMASGSWTLMHRFNLCFDLLQEAQANPEALAVLFVWLRYSAIRQLTWQRNYNTKPRELAHAQDRLGGRLAELYRSD